ncbi:hypothetical protein NNO_1525 [Hydrogenimonas sp.]|nr:hypothetical protein NNO_1525 [Hydrogenimonas sp.]
MIKLFFITIAIVSCTLLPASDDMNVTGGIDEVHEAISEWIYDTSNRIDIFFSGSSEDVSVQKGTYLDTSFDMYAETYRSAQYRYNISLKLRLPRTQKRLNLVLEDFKKTSSVDLPQSTTPGDTLTNNDYLLGVSYRQQESKYTRIGYGGGIRFRSFTPDPYLTAYISRSFYFSYRWELLLRNKVRYFADYRLDNTATAALIKIIDEKLRFSFQNIYHFLEHDKYRNEIVNTLSLEQFIGPKKGVSYTLSAYSSGDTDSVFKLGYYYGGASFRHYYYRNWAYYQVDGGVMFRESNNFSPSARAMFKIGFLFGRPKRLDGRFR